MERWLHMNYECKLRTCLSYGIIVREAFRLHYSLQERYCDNNPAKRSVHTYTSGTKLSFLELMYYQC